MDLVSTVCMIVASAIPCFQLDPWPHWFHWPHWQKQVRKTADVSGYHDGSATFLLCDQEEVNVGTSFLSSDKGRLP